MIRHLMIFAVASCVIMLGNAPATASHWAFRQAQFTHDPATGQRVTQYSESAPAYVRVDPTYQQSGQIWQNIRIRSENGGVDRIRLFERWGDPWYYGYPY